MSFPEQVSRDRGQPATVRIGTVTSVSPFVVSVQGTDFVGVGVLADYAAVVGDVVAVMGQSAVSADGSSWLVLGRMVPSTVGAAAAATVEFFSQVVFTTTSLVYTTAGAVFCGVVFTAPASGKVLVLWAVELSHGASFVLVSPQVASGDVVGSGTPFQAASDDVTCRNDGASTTRYGCSDLVSGLTPGAVYNVTLYHRVGGGTGNISRRNVIVHPVN